MQASCCRDRGLIGGKCSLANWLQNAVAECVAQLPYPVLDKVLFGNHSLSLPLQVAVQRLIGPERESTFMLDGHEFHCYTSQKVFFERSNIEQEVMQAALRFMKPSATIYDVGANIGFWLVRAAARCEHCVGFEPSPANLVLLRRNAGHLPGVTIVEAAVSSFTGSIRLSEDGTRTRVGAGEIEVPCITLDSYQGLPPTLIIIDVEGHAGEVVTGGMNLVAKHRPAFIVELHNKPEQERVVSLLSGQLYSIENLEHSQRFPFHILATAK